MLKAERGLFDLRQGRPLFVVAPDGSPRTGAGVVLAPVEALQPETLDRLRELGTGPLTLVVTRHRARAMGLVRPGGNGDKPPLLPVGGNGRPTAMGVHLNGEQDPESILRLASAAQPATTAHTHDGVRPATRAEEGGLTLARLGRLLPAMVAVEADPARSDRLRSLLARGTLLEVPVEEIEALGAASQLEVTQVSEASVPLEKMENTRFMLFRETHGFFEHLAVLIGDREAWPDPVPVRLHSACLTGDLFGSLRCDCGEQLQASLRIMAAQGGGVLLYLEQEGRGIGLGNKLRAYRLQEEGLDTVDADGTLGFGADERRYDSAVEILHRLGIERLRLLTNNPDKVRAVEEGGIEVVDRQPLHGTLNRHNLPYVRAKVRRSGHWLQDMLSGSLPSD